jgi:hypothetical protein
MQWADPLDPVAITVDEIVAGQRDILLVRHDEGHGGWQFYDSEDVSDRLPYVIPKDELLRIDPTLESITDLPVGWSARRDSKQDSWLRERTQE